ncbi:hypothetical protein HaLaN_30239, partial [Haematococcus lacustris]
MCIRHLYVTEHSIAPNLLPCDNGLHFHRCHAGTVVGQLASSHTSCQVSYAIGQTDQALPILHAQAWLVPFVMVLVVAITIHSVGHPRHWPRNPLFDTVFDPLHVILSPLGSTSHTGVASRRGGLVAGGIAVPSSLCCRWT